MMRNIAVCRSLQLVLTASALALASSGALAQQKEVPEVKIEAERSVQRVGTTATGVPVELIQLTRRVSYADLDIGTHSGATELEKRINEVAKSSCAQLEKLYPLGTLEGPGTQGKSCVKDAVNGAMVQAKASIAAAEKAKAIRSAEAPAK